jgi:tripartite-type tricarboxylate transporter receptor subunit TctC
MEQSFVRGSRVMFASLLLVASCLAHAQGFPTRPVRMIVAFPPGGGTDIVARIVGQKLSELWSQQVLIDNRAGAAGTIGTEAAARAPADGHTLFMGTLGNLAVNQHLYPKMTVNPIADLAPVTQVVDVHFVMVAHPSLAARNVTELVALAKTRPGQIPYSSSGAGGAPHLGMELFKSLAKIDLTHVPYKGSAGSFQDLLGGQVMLTADSIVQALPYLKNEKLRAIAVLGPARSPALPDVPTIAESGLPGYALTNWFGLVAPAATPREVIAKIQVDVSRVLQQPDIRDKLTAMGATAVGSTPDQFGSFIRDESAKWAKLIREVGIRAE